MSRWTWVILAVILGAAPAFGRDFEGWRVVSTEHFSFIYEPADVHAVEELLGYAETVYEQVTALIGSRPPHVDVVVYGNSDYGNGYFSSLPPAHIGLYVTPPTETLTGVRTESWLRGSLIHELTHFVQLEYQTGPLAALGSVFGSDLPGLSILFAPLWLIEGTAVVAESELGPGGRGDDRFFEFLYKAPIVERSMFSLAQSEYTSHLAPNGRHYVGGFAILDHIADTYGIDALGEVSRRFAAFPFFGVGGPIRAVTGKSLKDLYIEMVAALEDRFVEATDVTPLPLWSPDLPGNYYLPKATEAGLFLYRERPDRLPAIVRFDPQSGTEVPVVHALLTDPWSWTIDKAGRSVYFTSFDVDNLHPAGQQIETNIYRYLSGTSTIQRLTDNGGYNHPAVSPDGTLLAAVEIVGGFRRLVVFQVGDSGLSSRRVLLDWGQSSVYNPAFSPDGSVVAAAVNSRGRQDIVLVDLQTGAAQVLEMDTPMSAEYYPSFVDDLTLLFSSDRGGALSLYAYDVARDAARRIVDDPVGAYGGAIIGDELYYATYTNDGFAVRITDLGRSENDTIVVGGFHDVGQQPGEPRPEVAAAESALSARSTTYVDVPIPQYWYPYLDIAGAQSLPADIGGGITTGGAGVLQRNSWIAQAAYFPVSNQVQARAQWLSVFTPVSLGVESQLLYARVLNAGNPVFVQRLQETLSVSWGLLGDYHLGRQRSASVTGSLRHVLEYDSPTQFSIDQAFGGGLGAPSHYLFWSVGASISSRPGASQQAFFPPWATALSLAIGSGVPGLGSPPPGLQTRASMGVNVPLGFLNQIIVPSISATHSTDLATRSPVSLRGIGAPTDHSLTVTLPGSALISVDYRIPLGLVDMPLGFGFYVLGFGLSLFAETTVGFGLATGSVAFDRYVAVGVELLALIGFRGVIPVTLGVAAVFDRTGAATAIWPQDLRFILEVGATDLLTRTPHYRSTGIPGTW